MQNQETCEGKNRLSTGTFSFNNLENDADYSAKSERNSKNPALVAQIPPVLLSELFSTSTVWIPKTSRKVGKDNKNALRLLGSRRRNSQFTESYLHRV